MQPIDPLPTLPVTSPCCQKWCGYAVNIWAYLTVARELEDENKLQNSFI